MLESMIKLNICTYISNKPSASTVLDFSNNQEIQHLVERKYFFTNQCSKRLFVDMRDSLGVTGKGPIETE